MTQGLHKSMTSNCQRSLRHVAWFPYITTIAQILEVWRQNLVLTMAIKDKKEISFEREASIAEIHAQSASI